MYPEKISKNLVFLAGPIIGTNDWRKKAYELIWNKDPLITIVTPRIPDDISSTAFSGNELIQWELEFFDYAINNGSMVFWFPNETKHDCRYPFAQTSRVEIGRALERYRQNPYNLSIGADDNYPGKSYLETVIKLQFKDLVLQKTLEDTCNQALSSFKN